MPSRSSPDSRLVLATHAGCPRLFLFSGRDLLGAATGRSPQRGASELPQMVRDLEAKGGVTPESYGVVLGPGSFTGIRVGVAFLRGLARARGAEVLGLDGLEVLASSSEAKQCRVAADALRGEAVFRDFPEGPSLSRAPWKEVLGQASTPVLALAGSFPPELEPKLKVVEWDAFAMAAFDLLEAGEGSPKLEPIWTRPAWAEEARS